MCQCLCQGPGGQPLFLVEDSNGTCVNDDPDLAEAAIGFIKLEDAQDDDEAAEGDDPADPNDDAEDRGPLNLGDLDEFKKLIVDQEWVYTDPQTAQPESAKEASLRFTLFNALIRSCWFGFEVIFVCIV